MFHVKEKQRKRKKVERKISEMFIRYSAISSMQRRMMKGERKEKKRKREEGNKDL